MPAKGYSKAIKNFVNNFSQAYTLNDGTKEWTTIEDVLGATDPKDAIIADLQNQLSSSNEKNIEIGKIYTRLQNVFATEEDVANRYYMDYDIKSFYSAESPTFKILKVRLYFGTTLPTNYNNECYGVKIISMDKEYENVFELLPNKVAYFFPQFNDFSSATENGFQSTQINVLNFVISNMTDYVNFRFAKLDSTYWFYNIGLGNYFFIGTRHLRDTSKTLTSFGNNLNTVSWAYTEFQNIQSPN